MTDSVSLLSSLLDSSLDVIISLLNIAAIIYANKPADDDHRFGHRSIEDIVGLIQATFIASSSLFLIYEAINHFLHPANVTHNIEGIKIILISSLGTLAIILYQRHVAKKTKSLIVETDLVHYLSDFMLNIAVIVSLYLTTKPSLQIIDPIIAILIAIYILRTALKIGLRAFNNLMDHELPADEHKKIVRIIKSHPGVSSFHELKTRSSGHKKFIQLHIEINDNLSLKDAHEIADSLEEELIKNDPDSEIIIHLDPVSAYN